MMPPPSAPSSAWESLMKSTPKEFAALSSSVAELWLFATGSHRLTVERFDHHLDVVLAFLEGVNDEKFRLITPEGDSEGAD